MKQILQNLRTGVIEVADVPCPAIRRRHLLIQTRRTLISAGTERAFVEFGSANLINKARSQPDQVKKVLTKIRTDGLLPTLDAVFDRLDSPTPLGYCNSGVVLEVGEGAVGFKPGDRVASNGPHAEVVCVPVNLCAKIPDSVSDDEAAFTVISSIGLEGIRLIAPTLGESIAVTGLGLIGLLAVQMLRAAGCRVLGIDMDPAKLALAKSFGAEVVDVSTGADPIRAAESFTEGRGIDGVLITAAAKTDEIMHESAEMSRKRGRIVLVGVVGLGLRRDDFYKKELTFQVSCSYGPGRYDPSYEEQGNDYPLGYVRWTEQRNMQAVVAMLERGDLRVSPLISKTFEHKDATAAYEALKRERDLIGIMLKYPEREAERTTTVAFTSSAREAAPAGTAVAGLIGAGSFAQLHALPHLARAGARLACIADLNGVAATHAGRKFGVERWTTDHRTILSDPAINTVFVLTRHNSHAPLVLEALEAGKNVFVEKPLCMTREQLARIREAYDHTNGRQLMVGFNRRFAPLVKRMRELLTGRSQPLCMSVMVNAGGLPADHWALDAVEGGGRIIGEGCHWIDLMVSLTGSLVKSVSATMIGRPPPVGAPEDSMSMTMSFEDGSIGTLHYFPNGDRNYPKERIEVFSDGRVLMLDNFRLLRGYGFKGFKKTSLYRLDKGHRQEFAELVDRIRTGGGPVIPFEQIANVTLTAFAAIESARSGRSVRIDPGILDRTGSAVAEAQEPART